MMTFSDLTLGLLVEVADRLRTNAGLKTLLMQSDLWRYSGDDPIDDPTTDSLQTALLLAREEAKGGNKQAHRGLLKFVCLLLEAEMEPNDRRPAARFDELRNALLADGYQLEWAEGEWDEGEWIEGQWVEGEWFEGQWSAGRRTYHFDLLPTDPAPVPLTPEISALETELMGRGYNDTLNHYRQAVDNFIHHNYEAANAQLRTMLEDLVTRLASQHTGYVGQGRAGQGGHAISHMVAKGNLPERDGGRLLQDIWQMTHTHGSHPGQSDADEARFRMLLITATARFLLNRFR